MLMPRQLNIVQTSIVVPGGGPPLALCSDNPDRAYVIFFCLSSASGGFLALRGDGTSESIIADLSAGITLSYLRRHWGALVQQPIYWCDGSGIAPAATINVTEGILI